MVDLASMHLFSGQKIERVDFTQEEVRFTFETGFVATFTSISREESGKTNIVPAIMVTDANVGQKLAWVGHIDDLRGSA